MTGLAFGGALMCGVGLAYLRGASEKAKALVKEYEAEVESIGGAPEEAHHRLAVLRAPRATTGL